MQGHAGFVSSTFGALKGDPLDWVEGRRICSGTLGCVCGLLVAAEEPRKTVWISKSSSESSSSLPAPEERERERERERGRGRQRDTVAQGFKNPFVKECTSHPRKSHLIMQGTCRIHGVCGAAAWGQGSQKLRSLTTHKGP